MTEEKSYAEPAQAAEPPASEPQPIIEQAVATSGPESPKKPTSRHIGRKIWYGFVIFLSSLVILICAVGLIGTWVLESSISDAAVGLLGAVENGAGGMRQAAARVDGLLGEAQQVTLGISQSVGQVSQNISDLGLVMTLLPEEQEQKLAGLADQIRDTFINVKELVASGLEMYRTINRMPFINLPGPDPEQLDSIQSTLDNVRSDVAEARSAIQEIRTGAAAKVDRVTNAVVLLSERLQEGRDNLAALDSKLAAVQQQADSLQQVIPTVLAFVAVLLTLFLIYVGYTQVEVIRLYGGKWKGLNL
jgi:methyl-accepting chemotaxis protein